MLAQTASVTIKQGVDLNSIGISLDGTAVQVSDQYSTATFQIDTNTLNVSEFDLPAPPPDPSGEAYLSSLLEIE